MGTKYNSTILRRLLIEVFSDEKLCLLCYDEPEFKSIYDSFNRDTSKAEIINRLLLQPDQNLEILLALAKEQDPATYRKYSPYETSTHKADPSGGRNDTSSKVEPISMESSTRNWTKIGAIAAIASIIVAIVIAVIGWVISPNSSPKDPTPTLPLTTTFTYQVRVEAKGSGDFIPNARVIIEVGGQAPLDGITDSNGLARISVGSSYAGQPGRLLVEADGYNRYRQEIDIFEGSLPDTIQLEPE